jgi:hypothetical protein
LATVKLALSKYCSAIHAAPARSFGLAPKENVFRSALSVISRSIQKKPAHSTPLTTSACLLKTRSRALPSTDFNGAFVLTDLRFFTP